MQRQFFTEIVFIRWLYPILFNPIQSFSIIPSLLLSSSLLSSLITSLLYSPLLSLLSFPFLSSPLVLNPHFCPLYLFFHTSLIFNSTISHSLKNKRSNYTIFRTFNFCSVLLIIIIIVVIIIIIITITIIVIITIVFIVYLTMTLT